MFLKIQFSSTNDLHIRNDVWWNFGKSFLKSLGCSISSRCPRLLALGFASSPLIHLTSMRHMLFGCLWWCVPVTRTETPHSAENSIPSWWSVQANQEEISRYARELQIMLSAMREMNHGFIGWHLRLEIFEQRPEDEKDWAMEESGESVLGRKSRKGLEAGEGRTDGFENVV